MKFFISAGGAGAEAGFGAGGPDASRGIIAAHFLGVLSRLGSVEQVDTAAEGVRLARAAGPDGLHLCLALPHEMPHDSGLETMPVFGLGQAACPDSPFAGDPASDWRLRLGCCRGAVCLSAHAAEAVRALMGEGFPVLTAPPPISAAIDAPPMAVTLTLSGAVLDTARWAETGPPEPPASEEAGSPAWRKTTRYRVGVIRLHAVYVYREVVRDLLPGPVAIAISRIGRAGIAVARRLMAPAPVPVMPMPGDDPGIMPATFPSSMTGGWRSGTTDVALGGLVFAAVHGAWDRSWGDVLSAFVAVRGDDPGATLVVKTASLDPGTRDGLAGTLRRLGPFACRVVILDGTIEGGLDRLIAAASYYVCASNSEAAPLPMMRFLAAGRPAIAPDHSALADFVDATTGFVVASGPEYETFPGDVEERLAATGWRLEWEQLCACLAAACEQAGTPDYATRAEATARRLHAYCGPDAVLAALAPLAAPAPPRRRATGGRPLILVHSETHAGTVADRLGLAEYSYFFVLRFFLPVLERIGRVVAVSDPAREVDRLHAQAAARGEPCVFLSFSPPHRTPVGLACPTIPVFAWEFDTIPHEHWSGEKRHDWVEVLRALGRAIVHSEATVRTVRAAMGEDFPVWSIPAPVWDGFAGQAGQPSLREATLSVRGTVIDTAAIDMAGLRHDENWIERIHAERAERGRITEVTLDGVVYSSVLNPEDGRKNWTDMLAAFCRVFATEAGATLVLKLTHHDGTWGMALMLKHLRRLMPFACRVVLIHGYLPDADYARLVAVTTFAVNTSHGEGQCLPLMEAMSAGKPAVAPPHTGMADYLDEDCAFLVRSSAEPCAWPQDRRFAVRTHRRRIDLASLEAAYRRSFEVVTAEPELYEAMSTAAWARLRGHCSMGVAEEGLRTVLATLVSAGPARPRLRAEAVTCRAP